MVGQFGRSGDTMDDWNISGIKEIAIRHERARRLIVRLYDILSAAANGEMSKSKAVNEALELIEAELIVD